METHTIASYGLAIRKALEANGYDADEVFAAAGLDRPLSNDPMDRLKVTEVSRLFGEVVKATGNPAFGLVVARFMNPSALHALGYSLLASCTLRGWGERRAYFVGVGRDSARLGVRGVVGLSGWGAELGLQQDLFAGAAPRPHPKQDRLDTTLDAIRDKFGQGAPSSGG